MSLSGKTPEMIGFYPTTIFEQLEGIRGNFDYSERFSVPNILSDKYALTK